MTKKVVYFHIVDVPDKAFFECDRHRSTMSTESCAEMWTRANSSGSEKLFSCRGCPIGADHAGNPQISLSPLRNSSICARCHRGSTRLIGKRVCVSCKNREYEWARGYNARGHAVKKIQPLHQRAIIYRAGDVVNKISEEYTADTIELVVIALRESEKEAYFGMRTDAPIIEISQMELF